MASSTILEDLLDLDDSTPPSEIDIIIPSHKFDDLSKGVQLNLRITGLSGESKMARYSETPLSRIFPDIGLWCDLYRLTYTYLALKRYTRYHMY